MRNRPVATRYAHALLNSADKAGLLGEVAESFDAVMAVIGEKPGLLNFLAAPHISEDKKLGLLDKVFADRIETTLSHFFRLLVEKHRMDSLGDIHEEFQRQVEVHQGFARAVVTTAVPLSDDLEKALMEKLSVMTGRKIVLRKDVDPAVLGGACVSMGDQVIDGTLRTNLTRLRAQLTQTDVRV